MSWQPTVGTLNDEDLYLAKITIAALGYDDVVAHIDALTVQLERARGIAVALEQEVAQRETGWAARHRYATVELPDDDQHTLDADGTCTTCDDKAGVGDA